MLEKYAQSGALLSMNFTRPRLAARRNKAAAHLPIEAISK
jgi:hypothetical protein